MTIELIILIALLSAIVGAAIGMTALLIVFANWLQYDLVKRKK